MLLGFLSGFFVPLLLRLVFFEHFSSGKLFECRDLTFESLFKAFEGRIRGLTCGNRAHRDQETAYEDTLYT